MEKEETKKNHKKLIIIVVCVAAAVLVCLLLVFKPWEAAEQQTPLNSDAAQSVYKSALEDPDSHQGEEVTFTAETAADSQNIEGMLMLSGVVDNQYFVSLSYLDRDKTLSFNKGDKINVTGIITGQTLVPMGDGQSLNGAEIAVETIELVY